MNGQKAHTLVEAAEHIKEKTTTKLEVLADCRMQEWLTAFRAKFPRQHGRIIFGNGVEYIEFGGKSYTIYDGYKCLASLQDALYDVWRILDDYRSGTPNDIEW